MGWKNMPLSDSPTPLVQVRRLRPRGRKDFPQGHTTAKRVGIESLLD